ATLAPEVQTPMHASEGASIAAHPGASERGEQSGKLLRRCGIDLRELHAVNDGAVPLARTDDARAHDERRIAVFDRGLEFQACLRREATLRTADPRAALGDVEHGASVAALGDPNVARDFDGDARVRSAFVCGHLEMMTQDRTVRPS